MKYIKKVILILLFFYTPMSYSIDYSGGINFSLHRIVYLEKDRGGVSISLANESNNIYLTQAWIAPMDMETNTPVPYGEIKDKSLLPFIILPPLRRFESLETFNWQIKRVGDSLPKDRETIYWIAIKAIPSTLPDPSDIATIVVSPLFYWKLIYRPESIESMSYQDILNDISFYENNGILTIKNNSALYASFAQIKTTTAVLDDAQKRVMVAPFSERIYKIPVVKEQTILWQLFDENLIELEEKKSTIK